MKSPPGWWRLDRNHVAACKAKGMLKAQVKTLVRLPLLLSASGALRAAHCAGYPGHNNDQVLACRDERHFYYAKPQSRAQPWAGIIRRPTSRDLDGYVCEKDGNSPSPVLLRSLLRVFNKEQHHSL